MLNGSNKDAPVASKARLVAVGPPAGAARPKATPVDAAVIGELSQSHPKRMQWFVIPGITLASALAGGAAAWLMQ